MSRTGSSATVSVPRSRALITPPLRTLKASIDPGRASAWTGRRRPATFCYESPCSGGIVCSGVEVVGPVVVVGAGPAVVVVAGELVDVVELPSPDEQATRTRARREAPIRRIGAGYLGSPCTRRALPSSRMRRFLVVLALLLGACTPPSAVTTTGGVTVPPDAETVRPDHVVDGDTFEAGGIRFRLDGINAPDRGECMHEEARDRLEDVLGATVALAATGTDQFGRTLARVHADGLWVNLDMVSAGLALASGGDDVLLRAEDEAFRNRVGLWAVDACGAEGEIPAIAVEPAFSVFDPPGPDEDVLGEEQVVLRNEGD